MIDHTILKLEATKDDVKKVCKEAMGHYFATVCVRSEYIPLVAEELKGSEVKPISVIDFPKGLGSSKAKADEAKKAIAGGAKEIDMVVNGVELKNKNYSYVLEDIGAVVDASKPYPVKVILETGELNNEEKVIACALSKAAGAAFVKTSTGFGKGGATVEDISLMRRVVGPEMGVKASGGVHTREDALKMIEAGATRIGTSNGVDIVTGGKSGTSSRGE